MAHDSEKKEHFEGVDHGKNDEKNVKAGQGQLGEAAKQGVGEKWNSQHSGGKEKARFKPAIFWVEKRKGERQGHRTNDDEKKQDERDFLIRMHVRDSG